MEGDAEVKVEQPTNPNEKHHKKGQPREKRPRPQRKNQYERNPDLIDENTVIPPPPKKSQIIPKPDINVQKAKETKNNARIEEIIEKKKAVRAEKFQFYRKHGGGDGKHSQFQNEIGEVKELREKLGELKIERNELRERLHKLIDEAKANNEKLKEYRSSLQGSRQNFSEKLQRLEHRLVTADITKEEEKSLNAQIMLLKRKIREAESSGNIQFKLEQCEERKDQLDEQIEKVKKEKDPIEAEFTKIKDELDKKNEHITGLKGVITAEKTQKTQEKQRHDKEYQAWKQQKKVRLEKLEADLHKVREDNKKIWEEYHQKQDDFWKQKQYIDFIEWQTRVKERKAGFKERELRKAEYEKKDKEREKEDQLKKYLAEIQLINFLIKYLNDIKSESVKVEEKKEAKVNQADLIAKISEDNQWKKLTVIQSKKSKEDEQPQKKHKKNKKKNQQAKQEQKFNIPFNVQTMFQSLKLLAPSTSEGIEQKIQELKERQELFVRASREDSNEEDKKLVEEIKQKGKKQNQKVAKKVQEDFPTI